MKKSKRVEVTPDEKFEAAISDYMYAQGIVADEHNSVYGDLQMVLKAAADLTIQNFILQQSLHDSR